MKIKTLEWIGFFGVFAIGAFLYFAYDLFDHHLFIAAIAPVNNSIWELLKIPFFSMLLYGMIVYLLAKGEKHNLLLAKTISTIVTTVFSLMIYFGYTSLFEDHIAINAVVFFVSLVIGQFFSIGMLSIKSRLSGFNFVSLLLLCALIIVFTSYTHQPPTHDFFKDPDTGSYGR